MKLLLSKSEFIAMMQESIKKELNKHILQNTEKCENCDGKGFYMSCDKETNCEQNPLRRDVYQDKEEKISCKKCNGTGKVRKQQLGTEKTGN